MTVQANNIVVYAQISLSVAVVCYWVVMSCSFTHPPKSQTKSKHLVYSYTHTVCS